MRERTPALAKNNLRHSLSEVASGVNKRAVGVSHLTRRFGGLAGAGPAVASERGRWPPEPTGSPPRFSGQCEGFTPAGGQKIQGRPARRVPVTELTLAAAGAFQWEAAESHAQGGPSDGLPRLGGGDGTQHALQEQRPAKVSWHAHCCRATSRRPWEPEAGPRGGAGGGGGGARTPGLHHAGSLGEPSPSLRIRKWVYLQVDDKTFKQKFTGLLKGVDCLPISLQKNACTEENETINTVR